MKIVIIENFKGIFEKVKLIPSQGKP